MAVVLRGVSDVCRGTHVHSMIYDIVRLSILVALQDVDHNCTASFCFVLRPTASTAKSQRCPMAYSEVKFMSQTQPYPKLVHVTICLLQGVAQHDEQKY